MAIQAENGRSPGSWIDADSFIDCRAVMQAVRQKMYFCIFPGHNPAVHPDVSCGNHLPSLCNMGFQISAEELHLFPQQLGLCYVLLNDDCQLFFDALAAVREDNEENEHQPQKKRNERLPRQPRILRICCVE